MNTIQQLQNHSGDTHNSMVESNNILRPRNLIKQSFCVISVYVNFFYVFPFFIMFLVSVSKCVLFPYWVSFSIFSRDLKLDSISFLIVSSFQYKTT